MDYFTLYSLYYMTKRYKTVSSCPIDAHHETTKFYHSILFLLPILPSVLPVFGIPTLDLFLPFLLTVLLFLHITFCPFFFHQKISYGWTRFPFSGSGQPLKTILLHLSATIATLYPVIRAVLLVAWVNFSIWAQTRKHFPLTVWVTLPFFRS